MGYQEWIRERSSGWMAPLRRAPTALPWLSWIVLAIGVVASLSAVMWAREEVRQGAANEFSESARGLAEQVEQSVRAYADVIFSIRALLDASKDIDPGAFHRFAGGLAIGARYPGITNISYAYRVDGESLPSFEQKMRRAGIASPPQAAPFAMKPSGARPEYVVLALIEPLSGNQDALGLDLMTDPVRKAAVDAARDSGTVSTTAGMTLLRDAATHARSVLLRLGVYEGGGVPATVEERRQRLAGVAGVAIRMPQLMQGAMSHVARAHTRLRLLDITNTPAGATGVQPAVLFDSAAADEHAPPLAFPDYARTHNLAVGDRTWSIVVTPLGDPLRNSAVWMIPYAVGAWALMLSLLVFWLLRALGTAGRYAKSLKSNLRTIEEQRLRLAEARRRDVSEARLESQRERAQLQFVQTMMDAIPIPVFQKDTAGRFRLCNAAWCAFTGLSREAILGRTIGEIVPRADVAAIAAHDRTLFAHLEASSIQTAMPNAEGEMRQLTLHKASFVDSDGRIAGLVAVGFDVTEDNFNKERLEQTVAELARRNKLGGLLGDFGELLQTCLGSTDAYEVVEKYLPGLLPATSGALYCVEAGRGLARQVARWGEPSGIEETLQTSDCVAVRGGQARCVHDSTHELNCRHLVEMPSMYACLPLTSHGDLLGLLHVQQDSHTDSGPSNLDSDWPVVRTAAEHISLALANLSMRENLQEQATRDKLTGLYNRHYMSARLEQEHVRARRTSGTIAVILLDIDNFKHFNDTYGHAAGDHVLREFGAQLRRAGRESDVACRYGGEEFVLFMPDASIEIARRRAEEICSKTRALQLEFESHPLGVVTVSAGVAVYPDHGADPDAVMQAADRALYRAKELGRDRVVLAPPSSEARSSIDPAASA